jgi:CDP-4-dehydro-6-deoxyglucose reductase
MSYQVTLAPSGRTFTVETDETVLDAAIRQSVRLAYGCQNGSCGSCKARLLEGQIDYQGVAPDALTDRELDSGLVILCQATTAGDLKLRVEELDPDRDLQVRTLPARVVSLRPLSHDVMELRLELPPTERLQYLAGQYVDFVLRGGKRRAFSIANAPHDDQHLAFHIRRVPGGSFSEHVFTEMKPRALLRLRGPLGAFYLRETSDKPAILVAGGTGFAPIKSLLEDAFNRGVDRLMHLYWGVRERRDLYADDLLRRWAEVHEQFTYVPVLSEPDADWRGAHGFVHDAVLAQFEDLAPFEVYASGPPPMVGAIRDTFPARGMDLESIFYDSFDYAYETGQDI